jgi:hypothetical protein
MNPLRHLRHGPLLFWLFALAGLATLSVAALSVGSDQVQPVVASRSSSWDEVAGWRSSLAQLPVALADGSHVSLANSLAAVAEAAAESSAGTELGDAWSHGAEAARQVATVDPASPDAVYAALHGISLAGDRLAVVVSGSGWVPGDLPAKVPVVGEPGTAPGTGAGTGAGTPEDPAGAVNGPDSSLVG